MSDDNKTLQAYLESLPDKLTEELAGVIREQAELLSAAQKQALQSFEKTEPTGDLAASCVVVRGASDLEMLVQAGGELTTKEVREGSGVEYDYALGFEFGTSHQPARPFFWPTYQAHKDGIQQAIDEAANEVLQK
ncbi:Phage protein, HK97, gp10 [Nitrobacter hamburgensis X14]|uniref:Phage protein, HK97, gp10 n=1 Tax=Nitrobacter hamburgensis (strain DSM 10229 / NCIMB 13809 / X14) TaxID=323097 RepID=Q1QKH8_NITHX|nr:HK97-gp10 family putative phage morphogenesis protein [Nitrobacter hamburgensis]ABE63269.1 Phage protein, HK97, gp10 [Nitrobacter hamburgensis X14]